MGQPMSPVGGSRRLGQFSLSPGGAMDSSCGDIRRRARTDNARARGRVFAVAAAVASALAFAAVGAATGVQALTTQSYCLRTVAPMTKCPDTLPRHTFDQNTANGEQGRNNAFANKCEKITWWDNEGEVWSRRCEAKLSVTGRWNDNFDPGDPAPNTDALLMVYCGNNINYGYMYLRCVGAY